MKTSLPSSIVSNVGAYGKFVMSQKSLSAEEEFDLIKLYKETEHPHIAAKIINAFLKVPYSMIKKKFYWSGVPDEELIQEGNIALMKALVAFDLSFGVRFYSFACFHVEKAIANYIRNFRNLIKFASSNPKRKIQNNYSKYSGNIGFSLNKDALRKMASDLDVSEEDIIEYEKYRNSEYVVITSNKSEDNDNTKWEEVIPYESGSERLDLYRLIMYPIKNNLNERERKIIFDRWINSSKTFDELSGEFGVSIERVRQIEKKAFQKIKDYLISKGYDEPFSC